MTILPAPELFGNETVRRNRRNVRLATTVKFGRAFFSDFQWLFVVLLCLLLDF